MSYFKRKDKSYAWLHIITNTINKIIYIYISYKHTSVIYIIWYNCSINKNYLCLTAIFLITGDTSTASGAFNSFNSTCNKFEQHLH